MRCNGKIYIRKYLEKLKAYKIVSDNGNIEEYKKNSKD